VKGRYVTIISAEGKIRKAEKVIAVMMGIQNEDGTKGTPDKVITGALGTMSVTEMMYMLEHAIRAVMRRISELCLELMCTKCDKLNRCSEYLDHLEETGGDQ